MYTSLYIYIYSHTLCTFVSHIDSRVTFSHGSTLLGVVYNRFKLPPLCMAASFPLACNRYVVWQGRGEKLIACAFPPCPA